MAQEIIPDKQSVLSCLKQKVYYVDFYQREYVWTKNTVEVLLNDIFYAFEIPYKEHKDEEMSQEVLEKYNWYYLNVFIFNSEKSQLIITSQETTLLSQDLINENRGVVWFVEKNKETASSEYSRGDSFGLHKNLSLYNSYRIGRLGAKPELGSIFINLED